MQKLMRKWIFTLITCILLTVLAVLMFLDGFDIGGLYIGGRLIHLVAAIALLLYVIFALFPMMVRYKGILRIFVIGEIAILALTAVAHIFVGWFRIPLISSLEVCSVLGLALWLRGCVETVHAYFSAAETDKKKRIPLWKLLIYILISATGVWQLIAPTVSDRSFVFVIGILAAVMAALFGWLTVRNYRVRAARLRVQKEEAAANEAQEEAAPKTEAAPENEAEQETKGEQKTEENTEEEPVLGAQKTEE